MKSTYVKFVLFVLIVGLLSACGAQSTSTPTSVPTEVVAPATEAQPRLRLPPTLLCPRNPRQPQKLLLPSPRLKEQS